jgi:hypothetical protein
LKKSTLFDADQADLNFHAKIKGADNLPAPIDGVHRTPVSLWFVSNDTKADFGCFVILTAGGIKLLSTKFDDIDVISPIIRLTPSVIKQYLDLIPLDS